MVFTVTYDMIIISRDIETDKKGCEIMFSLSMAELGVILVVALMVFGPGKLPEVGKSLGKGIGEFKQALTGEPEKEKSVKIQEILLEKKVDETK